MTVTNFRSMVERSNTTEDLVKSFRSERLSIIAAGEFPSLTGENKPKIVLHMLPSDAFDSASKYDLLPLTHSDQRRLIEPFTAYIGETGALNAFYSRYNFDGLLSYREWPGISLSSYVQFFRNGIVEAVDVSILNKQDNKQIPHRLYEIRLCAAFSRYMQTLQFLKVSTPIYVMVSLLSVKGYAMSLENHYAFRAEDEKIDRPDLIVPEIKVEQFDSDPRKVMKPIFDIIWNAAGHACSANYDNTGKSILPQQR